MKWLAITFLAIMPALVPADEVEGLYEADAVVTAEPVAPDGTVVQCDLPLKLHMRNTGGSDGPRGPGSGSGLCVWTSLNHAAFWQNLQLLFTLQDYAKQRPGGGHPAKVDRYMEDIAKQANQPKPRYIQIESKNLDLLEAALRSGRMVSVTYYTSPSRRYGGARILHMVTLLHLDSSKACFLDNNFPRTYEWCSRDQAARTMCDGGKLYWAVVFMNPGPPPVPKN